MKYVHAALFVSLALLATAPAFLSATLSLAIDVLIANRGAIYHFRKLFLTTIN